MDPDRDKKAIDDLKKKRNPPQVVSIHFVLEGILKQVLDFGKHSLIN